ncbi:amino acid permease [Leptolyngbya sp. FACHB-36]|uniref:APC family permease n=1 Tax=Leptolyngbya sp. FACHB-36 TaxID=2692808 RepID=UPI0016807B42|nr:amino acid permease [Leptolyngbya sp. FACHB-36]MBD2020850.1 amino acid permease [Leptolyngbya sp. FACHB-36]
MSLRNVSESTSLSIGTARIKPALGFADAVAITVGIVIGAGIFETPALVAANLGNGAIVALVWLLGGVISLIGALCYAELATTYPHPGGNYHYLGRAFGRNVAFLFAWARMTVVQPGSIVLLAFVFGDYASQVLQLGTYSSSIYAMAAVVLFTGLNVIGVTQGKWTQNLLSVAEVLGLALVAIVGLIGSSAAAPPPSSEVAAPTGNLGLAMVFVLLSYGGWNEAAYISAELRDVRRNMLRSLLWSIGIISVVYVLINLAYLHGLGVAGMAQSDAVAADLMRRVLGEPGVWFIGFLISVSALGSINATIITGARTNFALGQDFPWFSFMGRWHDRSNTPIPALLVQGIISVVLVILGTSGREGFKTMVDYTAPVFWFFFLLTGISLLVLRSREPNVPRPFQVPLYPWLPILFCLVCGYLLYASLVYTEFGALVGVGVVLLGAALLVLVRLGRGQRS